MAHSVDEGAAPRGAVVPAGAGAAGQAGSATNGIIPQIQNTVVTVNLDCTLDLVKIAQKARNCTFNPKRFCAVIMRIREPKTTALLFSTGKMVCTGAKSEALASHLSCAVLCCAVLCCAVLCLCCVVLR